MWPFTEEETQACGSTVPCLSPVSQKVTPGTSGQQCASPVNQKKDDCLLLKRVNVCSQEILLGRIC